MTVKEFAQSINAKPQSINTWGKRGKLVIVKGTLDVNNPINKQFLTTRNENESFVKENNTSSKPIIYNSKNTTEVAVENISLLNKLKALKLKEEIKTAKIKNEALEINHKIELENLNNLLSQNEATKKKEHFSAKLKELEFKEKEGTLVLKSDVYLQLFEFGKQIKTEFESLPTRIAAKIINKDITKITEILAIAIKDSLNKITENLSNKKIC